VNTTHKARDIPYQTCTKLRLPEHKKLIQKCKAHDITYALIIHLQ